VPERGTENARRGEVADYPPPAMIVLVLLHVVEV
jgi:hypothetical protein